MNIPQTSEQWQTSGLSRRPLPVARRSQSGIAMVITLIMLAITLVMAVAFLALARRERSSVNTSTDTATTRLATDAALANALAQINANILSSYNNNNLAVGSANAYAYGLLVSTNYINPVGFQSGVISPINVNYAYANGTPLSAADLEQNVANLFYLPRAPVFVATNANNSGLDFRYYLDLNENGRYDTNYVGLDVDNSGNVLAGLPYLHQGDPEWVAVLDHPDAPHGPNNLFVARYAYIALPIGNSLDANYIHNESYNVLRGLYPTVNPSFDGFLRNEGVGSWELNLAGFLADLNTNEWDSTGGVGLYNYMTPNGNNNLGTAFYDASSFVAYRYANNYNNLGRANNYLGNLPYPVGIDGLSDGPLLTTLDINPLWTGDNFNLRWSGSDNPNHYFTLSDFLDASKVGSFATRLRNAGTYNDTYDRYTYYRMLSQLSTDSTADQGKLDLNYSNAVVSYTNSYGINLPSNVGIIVGAETNLVPWRPLDFFTAAADRMLRLYTTNWYGLNGANYVSYTNTYAVTNTFGITSIPVWVSNRFVYTPAVHRLLQLAANLYDSTTSANYNLPHVYRPIFERVNAAGDIFIVGYTEVTFVSDTSDPQLAAPQDINQLAAVPPNAPIVGSGGVPINVYGVPWIIGAKKGLPAFNQLAMVPVAQLTRRLQVGRTTLGAKVNVTNQMYVLSITNNVQISFWNSSNTNYYSRTGQGVTVYAADAQYMQFTNNKYNTLVSSNKSVLNQKFGPANYWSGSLNLPGGLPLDNSFVRTNWTFDLIPQYIYHLDDGILYPYPQNQNITWDSVPWPLNHQGKLGLMVTNYLQAYILDGHNVIDYVQFRDPNVTTNIDDAVRDYSPNEMNYKSTLKYLWETNVYNNSSSIYPSIGVINQINDSANYGLANAAPYGAKPDPAYGSEDQLAATLFYNYLHNNVDMDVAVHQAPFTVTRTVYCPFLLQANDPLVHTLASDLTSPQNVPINWAAGLPYISGVFKQNDDVVDNKLPTAPSNPIGARYQPWMQKGFLEGYAGTVSVMNSYAVKDSLVRSSDNWDFPSSLYPSIGWIGRVHRGTPWQTVYLKSPDFLKSLNNSDVGTNTWAFWTGDINKDYFGRYFDAANAAPVQDRLLFDIFTTRMNENSSRGTLSVNAGAGLSDGGLAAWSALFSGMVVLSNNAVAPSAISVLSYTNLFISPAGTMDTTLPYNQQSPLWQIVNGPSGINATRTNTAFFPLQAFTHVGDILSVPALTTNSPFLNQSTAAQFNYGINDQQLEWLPQQMMGLVRLNDQPRYVVYVFGQALRPAPGGRVLTAGAFFDLVTNYQVVAESAARAVIRVDGANTSKPHAVVESYNVLPPN